MRHRRRESFGAGGERGYVLLTALLAMILLLTATALLASALERRLRGVERGARDAQLTAIADGGIAFAMARLSVDPGYRGTIEDEGLGAGRFALDVERIASDQVVVEATAKYGTLERRVVAAVEVRPGVTPKILGWGPLSSGAVQEP